MFAKNPVTQSMLDAVNRVLEEDKKKMITDDQFDETGFHKAAHAAKRANQSHFEFQGKKYPVTAKSHKEAIEMDEASLKIPTATGTKVLGGSGYGSKKAHDAQHKNPFEKGPSKAQLKGVKAPSKKELKSIGEEDLSEAGDCVTEPQAKKIAKKEVKGHEKSMHKEGFANKLLTHIKENKAASPEEVFTDNNLGEEEMTDKQMKKREKIVLSMKKGEAGFKQRYGKNWKNVMYATATKQAMKEDASDTWNGSYDFLVSEEVIDLPIDPQTGELMDDYEVLVSGDTTELKKNQRMMLEEGDASYKKMDPKKPFKKMSDVVDRKKTVKDLLKGRQYFGTGKVKEEVELDEKNNSHTHAAHYENEKGEWTGMNLFTAKDDEDAVKQAQAKCKEGCRLSKVERHTTVKEAVDTAIDKSAHKITTDMLRGRVSGGKLNSFKSYKVNLTVAGEEDIPKEVDQGEDTKEKQKITTNPGAVDIKMDDKLTGPTPYTHFSSQEKITNEEVRGELKKIRSKEYKERDKEIGDFNKKVAQKEEVEVLGESGLLDKYLLSKGINPKFISKETKISHSKSNAFKTWAQSHQTEAVESPPPFDKPYKTLEKDVITDKSGAKHGPMSRARDLAKQAFKKVKQETMMGKISN